MFREGFIHNLSATLDAGSGTTFVEYTLAMKTDFVFKRSIFTATSNDIYIKFFNNKTGLYLYKSYDDVQSVVGQYLLGTSGVSAGFIPFNWPLPYEVDRNSVISLFLADYSGAPNTFDIAYHGDMLWPEAPIDMHGKPLNLNEKRPCVPITYVTNATLTVGTNNQVQAIITTDRDADFICTKVTGTFTATPVYVTVEDLSRETKWQNQKTHMVNFMGNGQFPNVFTSPIFVKANSQLLFTFDRIGSGAPNTIQVCCHGYKRY